MASILVTGAAGFIGFHLSKRLLEKGERVLGLDNLNPYYELSLKRDRLEQLIGHPEFEFFEMDLEDREKMGRIFTDLRPVTVVHLAAQVGVRCSITNPHAYVSSNLVGFLNVLEGCRHTQVRHLVFASSSSVYGASTKVPFSVHQNVDHPVSLYAATKKANELMAHTYCNLYDLRTTGLRFFTVYGPWGRPDMATFLFTKAILDGQPLEVFGHGRMQRDFTYIDDVIEGLVRVIDRIPQPNPQWTSQEPDPATSFTGYRIYNIGNNQPVELLRFIEVLEEKLGRKAIKKMLPMQPGDVPTTCADTGDLFEAVGFQPSTSIQEGIERFVKWYRDYYKV